MNLTAFVAALASVVALVVPAVGMPAIGMPERGTGVTASVGPVGSTAVTARSGWSLPLHGPLIVLRPFKAPSSPYGAGHRGVDLAARPGQPVFAAAGGTVIYAAPLAGRGVVSIAYGDLRITYEPVRAAVPAGARVTGGQLVGRLEPSGGHCGGGSPCLHLGLRRGGIYLDPSIIWRPAPARLLPIWDDG